MELFRHGINNMRGFIVTDHNEGQVVNLPAGEYTYSFRVIPVGSTYTFKIDNLEFTVEDLTPGVMTPRLKCIFELNTTGSKFYLSDTLGDCIYEPQIESGIFDTTPGPNLLDFERMISEVGLEINEEFISIYAKKADVTAEINLRADAINSVVGSLSNDVNELQGNYSSIEQTVDSLTSTVAGHTSQMSTFQQTVNQIYLAIEDAGSGEFSSIIQRLDDIEIKVGAPGQGGSIHAAINAINLMVSDIDEGLSSIELTVNDISSTVSTHTGQMSVVQQSVNSISSTVSTHTGQISAFQQTVDEISSTVSAHTGQISTFQQTVDEIYLAVEDAVSGEYSSIIQRLNSIEVKVGDGEGTGSIQATSTGINLRVDAIDIGLTDVTITASGLLSSVSDLEDNLSTVNQTIDGWRSTVTKAGQIASQILQENGTVKISAEQIELEGSETADGNFVVNVDGTITAKGAEIHGSLSTRGYGSQRVDIDGSGMNIYNILGNRQIEFGVNEYGDAVLRYYDNNGVMLYDLGPKGLSMINVVEEAWIEVNNLLFLGSNYTTVLTTTAIKNKYKRPFSQSQVTYYRYRSQRIGNIIEDAVNDGKIFVSPSKSANKIPMGIYCIRQDAFRYNLFGEPYSTPIRQHSSNEVYNTGSLYQIYFQPLLDINQGILGYSTFDAFWSERNGVLPDEQ